MEGEHLLDAICAWSAKGMGNRWRPSNRETVSRSTFDASTMVDGAMMTRWCCLQREGMLNNGRWGCLQLEVMLLAAGRRCCLPLEGMLPAAAEDAHNGGRCCCPRLEVMLLAAGEDDPNGREVMLPAAGGP